MSLEVRTVDASEMGGWVVQRGVGFLSEEPPAVADYLLGYFDLERTWGAFDGPRVVGTLRSFPTALTVPGPLEVAAAGLTNVTVAPTHRRRGLLSQMITADLRWCADAGEAVSILIASEYPIYGRFGYGAAVDGARYSVRTAGARFVEPRTGAAGAGTVELVERAELRTVAPAVYDAFRRAQPGSIERPDRWWDAVLHLVEIPGADPPSGFQAVYRSPEGEAEGFVRYKAKQDWDGMVPQGTLEIHDLVAATAAAYQGLWEYSFGIDLLTSIDAGARPVDEVLPLLLHDGRHVKQSARHDFVWARVLDTPAALTGRRYAVDGTLVLEVVDAGGLAGGRFLLEGGPEGATCSASDAPPDLSLPAASLGSAYLGGAPFQRLAAAGLVDEHRTGALARADAMFLTARAPWCATWF